MRLPKNLLSPGTYAKPRIYLCETDKTRICQLETTNTNGSFKFKSHSEISFEVARVYNDTITGQTKVNPFYDKIDAPRLIYLENFGYFELQGPELVGDGIKESKSCVVYSLEYTLSTKFLEDFYVNTGKVDSLEVLNATDKTNITPIILYNPNNTKLSLLHLVLEKAYGWKIGHVDESLHKLSRQFEVDRESIYDFLMNEVCEKFNCYIVFDTIDNTINIYAESLTSKFIGDGATKTFTIYPPFTQIGTVSIDGYKTTRWNYIAETGTLQLDDIPESGSHIEVVDGALTAWETDVFVTFDNLAQEVNIQYDAESIKTVLTVTYGDDLDIRETNMGLPYLTDLSYFYSVDWMGQDLYDAYTIYMQKCNNSQSAYTDNARAMLEIANNISWEENRLSLEYSIAQSVNDTTVGTYYVRGGSEPNYYYTEVSLPDDYVAGTIYYSTNTANLQDGVDGNVRRLYEVLKKYFNNEDDWKDNELINSFAFMENNALRNLYVVLESVVNERTKNQVVENAINNFLSAMWKQVGRTPLKSLYYEQYKQIQITNIEAGWSQETSNEYGYYYPVVLYLNSIDNAIAERDKSIESYNINYSALKQENLNISNDLLMHNNFTEGQMVRLSAFLREDELHLDDIVETSQTTVNESFQLKQDAMESGRIELQNISKPQLQFSMTMGNIYALPEFEPIIDQFQLGKVIKVGLRRDYVKQSRLLQVDLNFDDFSDFSCEFGDLTSLRTQSDIHADLLKKAVQAGKSVATNSSYWTKGSDQATATDLKIQSGLLDANTKICSIDGTQSVVIDKYGIKLQKQNEDGSMDPAQAWFVNNNLLFTSDGWKSTRMGIGEFTAENIGTFYGVIAEAVLSGYIESSTMVGGTIKIGLQDDGSYAFEVHEDGSVTMSGGSSIDGYAKTEDVADLGSQIIQIQDNVDTITNSKMYRTEIQCSGPMIMNTKSQVSTLSCKVYSWDVDITDTLDASLFNWKRASSNSDQDTLWNNNTNHQKCKTLTITTEDIINNANFYCEVSLPE